MTGINLKLYPQYNVIKDRRKESSPVEFERRKGEERRSEDRIHLDTKLTKDIFQIKNQVEQIQSSKTGSAQGVNFTQNASKIIQNLPNGDKFIKSAKEDLNKISPKEAKENAATGSAIGAAAFVLGGIVVAACMGVAGVVVATGLGAYFGAKTIKNVISSHMRGK